MSPPYSNPGPTIVVLNPLGAGSSYPGHRQLSAGRPNGSASGRDDDDKMGFVSFGALVRQRKKQKAAPGSSSRHRWSAGSGASSLRIKTVPCKKKKKKKTRVAAKTKRKRYRKKPHVRWLLPEAYRPGLSFDVGLRMSAQTPDELLATHMLVNLSHRIIISSSSSSSSSGKERETVGYV